MTHGWRFTAGAFLGVAVGALVWSQVVAVHPIFAEFAPSGLISWFVAAIVGGAIAGAFAPHHKVIFASAIGLSIGVMVLSFLVRHGWSHGHRNPFLWFGPVALLPVGHAIGGFLTRRIWRAV